MMEIDLDERAESGWRWFDVSMLKTDDTGFASSFTSSRCFFKMLDVSVKPVPGFLYGNVADGYC